MDLHRVPASVALLTVLAAGVPHASAQQPPPMPKPGPEHAVLKMDVGTWDAVVESMAAPGAPPTTSKGVEVNTIGCGGLCLISDFKGQLAPGMAFHGHGITTWDVTKKKYTGSWTDSMSQGMLIGETSWDPASKKATGTMEGPDASGRIVKMRSVTEYVSATSRVMTAYAPGPDGKEIQALKITYKKRSK
jgi:uncharacterized protein DUF1579